MTDLGELRSAHVERSDEEAVIAALVHDGPTTAPALAALPQFRHWSQRRLDLTLGAVWGDGKVTVDESDAFVPLRCW